VDLIVCAAAVLFFSRFAPPQFLWAEGLLLVALSVSVASQGVAAAISHQPNRPTINQKRTTHPKFKSIYQHTPPRSIHPSTHHLRPSTHPFHFRACLSTCNCCGSGNAHHTTRHPAALRCVPSELQRPTKHHHHYNPLPPPPPLPPPLQPSPQPSPTEQQPAEFVRSLPLQASARPPAQARLICQPRQLGIRTAAPAAAQQVYLDVLTSIGFAHACQLGTQQCWGSRRWWYY